MTSKYISTDVVLYGCATPPTVTMTHFPPTSEGREFVNIHFDAKLSAPDGSAVIRHTLRLADLDAARAIAEAIFEELHKIERTAETPAEVAAWSPK